MSQKKWASRAAQLYSLTKVAFYLYRWLVLIGAAGIIWSFVRSKTDLLSQAVLCCSLGLIVGGVVLWMKWVRSQFVGDNPGLKVLRMQLWLKVLGGGQYEYVRDVRVKALHNGIDNYKMKIYWTGQGSISPHVHDSQQNITTFPSPSGFLGYRVDFERPLRKREELDITIMMHMKDEALKAQPFFGISGVPGMRNVELRVCLPDNYTGSSYKRQILLDRFSDIPLFEETTPLDNNGKIVSWDLGRLRPDHCYRICW